MFLLVILRSCAGCARLHMSSAKLHAFLGDMMVEPDAGFYANSATIPSWIRWIRQVITCIVAHALYQYVFQI